MKGVLILAHGSREKQTEETFNTVVDLVRDRVEEVVETAYMEFSEKNIAYGLNTLVSQGVTEINVVPYFLFKGVHLRKDIPEEIAAFLEGKSGIAVTIAEPLGSDPRLAEILAERIKG
jgi:sirohydrochlorin ferrochelatase